MDRRDMLRRAGHLGCLGFVGGFAGCTGILDRGDDIQDSDDDGVIDSEDYAPRDPDVQAKSDLMGDSDGQNCECPETETETRTKTPAGQQVVIEDFEDGSTNQWGAQSAGEQAFQASSDAVHGDFSGELIFTDHPKVWKTFQSMTPSELSFWWKSENVEDNELVIAFHNYSDNKWASYDTAGFGMEVGAENSSIVVATPPFENTTSWVPLYEGPQQNTWYKTRFFNIDFQNNICDVALYDQSETQLGEVTNHSFEADISSVNYISIKNAMNFSEASAYIDHIVAINS